VLTAITENKKAVLSQGDRAICSGN